MARAFVAVATVAFANVTIAIFAIAGGNLLGGSKAYCEDYSGASAYSGSAPSGRVDLSNATLEQVDQLKARAKDRGQRLSAMADLIRIASTELYRSGSVFFVVPKEQSVIRHKAFEALLPYVHDEATLAMCMQSPDRDLRFFGVHFAPQVVNSKNFTTQIPGSLIAPLRRIAATDNDSGLREDALRLLQQVPGQKDYVASRVAADNDPSVFSTHEKDDGQFNKRITAILRSGDLNARLTTLMFIGSNRGSTAKMYWRNFDVGTLNAVIARAHNSTAEERARVAYALPTLQDAYPDQVRKQLVLMTSDPLADVRWRAAIGLQDLMTTPESKGAVEKLLKDPDDTVRMMALISLGPLNYPDQLKAMAKSNNSQCREFASSWLNVKPGGPARMPQGKGRARGSIEQ